MGIDDSKSSSRPQCLMQHRDLVGKAETSESTGRGGLDMVRMFKRLLRSGSKQRVVGGWLF
jgi:hypothetical protein